MDVINPATEEVLAECPRASEAQLNPAVAAAKAAFPAWAATPIDERRKADRQIADVIEANIAELARLLTQEQGKPLADATGEVMGMAGFFRYFTSLDLPMKVIEDSDGPQGRGAPPPAGRHRRDHAVELPADDPRPSRCRRRCWPATPWCSSRRRPRRWRRCGSPN